MSPTLSRPPGSSSPTDANALPARSGRARPPRSTDGELVIGGVAASDLVAEFGTPLYVVDEADARAAGRARSARRSTASSPASARTAKVYYAGKAFLSHRGRPLGDRGGPQHRRLQRAASSPSRSPRASTRPASGFHGNNKSLAEIDRAVAAGVGAIVIDSAVEIERVAEAAARHGRVQPVRLRVNSGRARLDPRVPRDGPRRPEVRHPARRRRRRSSRAIRAQPSLDFLGLHSPHRLADLRVGRLRRGRPPAARRARRAARGRPGARAQPRRRLRHRLHERRRRRSASTSSRARFADIVAAECAALGIPVPVVAIEPGRVDHRPVDDHALHGRHDQGRRGRRPTSGDAARPHATSASTAA